MAFIRYTNDKRTNGMVTPGGKCSEKFGTSGCPVGLFGNIETCSMEEGLSPILAL